MECPMQWDWTSQLSIKHTSYIIDSVLPLQQLVYHWKENEVDLKERYGHHDIYVSMVGNRTPDCLYTGSRPEGLDVPPYRRDSALNSGDFDIMRPHQNDVYNYTVDSDHTEDGFIRLVANNPSKLKMELLVSKTSTSDFYISHQNLLPWEAEEVNSHSSASSHSSCKKSEQQITERHGPALTMFFPKNIPEIDHVFALPHRDWPHIAEEWPRRKRVSGWPSPDLVQKILSKGIHVVPVPHPLSKDPNIEWRYSFSQPELILTDSLLHRQKQVYILLKAVLKHSCRETSELKSYFLKTNLLWCCEQLPALVWTLDNIASSMFFVIDNLLRCFYRRFLPNYFIRHVNLIRHVPDRDVRIITKSLRSLRRSPVEHIFSWVKNNKLPFSLKVPERSFAGIVREAEKFSETVNVAKWYNLTDKINEVMATELIFSGKYSDALVILKRSYPHDNFAAVESCHEIIAMCEILSKTLSKDGISGVRMCLAESRFVKFLYDSESDVGGIDKSRLVVEAERNEKVMRIKQAYESAVSLTDNVDVKNAFRVSQANFLIYMKEYERATGILNNVLSEVSHDVLAPIVHFDHMIAILLDANIKYVLEKYHQYTTNLPVLAYCWYLLIKAHRLSGNIAEVHCLITKFKECVDSFPFVRPVSHFVARVDGLWLLGYAYMDIYDYPAACRIFGKILPLTKESALRHSALLCMLLELLLLPHTRTKRVQDQVSYVATRVLDMLTENVRGYQRADLLLVRIANIYTGLAIENREHGVEDVIRTDTINELSAHFLRKADQFYQAALLDEHIGLIDVWTSYASFLCFRGQYDEAIPYVMNFENKWAEILDSEEDWLAQADPRSLRNPIRAEVEQRGEVFLQCPEYSMYLAAHIHLEAGDHNAAKSIAGTLVYCCREKQAGVCSHIMAGHACSMIGEYTAAFNAFKTAFEINQEDVSVQRNMYDMFCRIRKSKKKHET